MNTTPNESDGVPYVQPVTSVACFTTWVDKCRGGNMLFRGMANAEWSVESSLHRRLKHNKLKDVSRSIYHNIFVEMVKILISRSRRNGHDIENGRELKDLELLANLQHYGAATCLIDFTKNSLVALYFACASVNDKTDGKVVAFNSDDTNLYKEISIEDSNKKIEYWFKDEENKKIWILSPKKISTRITAQQSVFVFGSPTLSTDNFHICKIKNKKAIMEELKKYGISAETLFDDFVGFSAQNSYNTEYENWNTDSYLTSGMICYVSGDFKTAIEYYDKEIKSNPESYEAYYNRGLAKNRLENFEDAICDYDKSIKLNSEYSLAYNNRGYAKNKLGNFQGAISDYDESIKLNSGYSTAYRNRGNSKRHLGNFQDAILDYDNAIKLNPKYSLAYNNRGSAKNKLGNFQDAISDYDKAIRLDPEYSVAYKNRGNSKRHLGNFQDAILDYDNAIKLNPKYSLAYNNRGSAKNKLGNFQDAISDYDEAIRLDSKYLLAYKNRRLAKIKLGDKKGAAADLAKAKKIELKIKGMSPNNPKR